MLVEAVAVRATCRGAAVAVVLVVPEDRILLVLVVGAAAAAGGLLQGSTLSSRLGHEVWRLEGGSYLGKIYGSTCDKKRSHGAKKITLSNLRSPPCGFSLKLGVVKFWNRRD